MSSYREMQIWRVIRVEHTIQAFLQAAVVVLKGEVQHRTLVCRVIPKLSSRADVVGKLQHKETLADLRCAYEQICTRIK